MGRKRKFSCKKKIAAVEEYLSHKWNITHVLNKLNITNDVFGNWLTRYQSGNPENLLNYILLY